MNTGKLNQIQIPVLGLIVLLFMGCATEDTQTVVNFTTRITMQDEFNVDGAPNGNIWGFDIGTGENGWGNNEL